MAGQCLVLRLAGPLQSWGSRSQFNRRETGAEPTKSGIIGLLAAAQGRRRSDSIEDLLDLHLGVRTDQAGSLLRDYHTVSDLRGRPLLSASVTAKGLQKPTSPAKAVHVTARFYLQDAVFVAAVGGPADVLAPLREAMLRPAFPLALGRRACAPTQPLVLDPPHAPSELWPGDPLAVLGQVPWQVSEEHLRQEKAPATADLTVTVDDPGGDDVRTDVPRSFEPATRSFTTRRVRHAWVSVSNPFAEPEAAEAADDHDPFALLGW